MNGTDQVGRDLIAAAEVHAVCTEVLQALEPLASAPLDIAACEVMRQALDRIESHATRAAVKQLMNLGATRGVQARAQHLQKTMVSSKPSFPSRLRVVSP